MNKEQRIVAVLSIIIFLVMTGITIITPVLPYYATTLGATLPLIGVLVGSFAAARVVLAIPAGIFGDRFGNRKIMAIGLLIICISSLIAGFALNYVVLLLARIFEGIGSAFFATMSTAYLARNTTMDKRGRYMGIFVGALLLGQVSGPGIGGVVADAFGPNSPFFFYALISAIGLIILFRYIERDEVVDSEKRKKGYLLADMKAVLRNKSFLLVNIGTLAAFFARGGVIATLFPVLVQRNFGITDITVIGLVLTGVAIMSLVTMLPSGVIADKYGRKIPFSTSLILGGIVVLFIPLAGDLTILALVMLVFGLSLGLSGPMAAWAADLSEPKRMGTAMGVYRAIGDLGFLLGPVILTTVADAANPATITYLPFVICCIWLLVSGLALLKARDPAARRTGVGPAF
ncbi:MAG: MFS transporter [Methanobacteriota archaeon]|nr:MAG: MFS transporter [Euryarchaeota archaeon]